MKAWYIESYGGPDQLRRGDLPEGLDREVDVQLGGGRLSLDPAPHPNR